MFLSPAIDSHLSRSNSINTLRRLYSIYCHFQTRAELARLIRWAERRCFPRVADYYRFLYSENEVRIARDVVRFRRLCHYAQLASIIYQAVFQPKPMRKCAGQVYRLRKRSLIWI